MAISARRGEPFILYFTPPVILRLIPLAVLAFVVLQVSYAGYTIGSSGISSGFHNYPELWWLVPVLIGFIAITLRLVFPPRRTQARLEIRHDSVSFVPRRIDQRVGDSVTAAAVTPQSAEILLCHKLLEEMHDSFSVVIRGNDEPEREVRVEFGRFLDQQYCQKLAEGITSATGLPVRLVTRRRSTDGTVQETEWIPTAGLPARAFVAFGLGAVPFVGGIVVGWLRLRPEIILAIGAALWLAKMLVLITFARRYPSPNKPSMLTSLSSIFPFGAAYGLAAVIAPYVFPGLTK
jgi:hypothetical protein